MQAGSSRLASLFERIGDAAHRGDEQDLLRLADSARRFAPANATAQLVYARSLLHAGQPAAAWRCLAGRKDAHALLLRAESALASRRVAAALRIAAVLLRTQACDALPGLNLLARRLCDAQQRYPGWVGIDSHLRLVGELRGAASVTIEWRPSVLQSVTTLSADGAFAVDIPSHATGRVVVRAAGRELLGSGQPWPSVPGVKGWSVLEHQRVIGEFSYDWNESATVTVEAIHRDADSTSMLASARVEPAADASKPRSFSLPLDSSSLPPGELDVELLLPDGQRIALVGSPFLLPQPAPRPIAPMIARSGRAATPPPIDVVVPVYRGLQDTLKCLLSVLDHTPEASAVVVVDDASPDDALRAALCKLESQKRIALIRNPKNLGFPGAVNRGLRVHPTHDAVLLNADAMVSEGWLQRLRDQAYRSADIGTVTPLGEDASIVSYGNTRSGALAPTLDRLASRVNAGLGIEVPVGVGFCMYIKRECLDETGEFDERSFGRGYGEENDFCLRARELGWRHVAAADVFVSHLGGVSFGEDKTLLMRRNSHVLNHRFPGYDDLVAAFHEQDPLLPAKRALDCERLIEQASRSVLLVTLNSSGGVQRHVDERRLALEALGQTVIELRPELPSDPKLPARALRLRSVDLAHLLFRWPDDADALNALLDKLQLVRIELHHFLGIPADAWALLTGRSIPYHVVLHDYSWVCPQLSFVTDGGQYCGQPSIATCEDCLRVNGSKLRETGSVAALRTRSKYLLQRAARIIAPSLDVRRRLGSYFPELPIEVKPWQKAPRGRPTPAPSSNGQRVRVLLIGALGLQKGYGRLLECAADAAARDLPVDFVVLGFTSDDDRVLATGRVFVTGPYEEAEVRSLIQRERCDVAWFPTVGPETWCYTLTHALGSGLPIVAFDIGAIAERLRAADTGILLATDSDPAAINEALLAAAMANRSKKPDDMDEHLVTSADPERELTPPALSASVELLTLPPGLYVFTVESGGVTDTLQPLMLPALQVAPAPVRTGGTIEFLAAPHLTDRWLTRAGDALTVRVSGLDANLMLTSVRDAASNSLSIDVRRLDAPPVEESKAPTGLVPVPVSKAGPQALTLIHVPYLGDLTFMEGWAGKPADNLWIEAFSVLLLEPDLPDLLEYRGVTEEGEMTDWVSGGELCGERGTGVPMVAFAIRLAASAGEEIRCSYRGRFLSGAVLGPYDDGQFCRSGAPGDPLVAIEIQVTPVSADIASVP